MATATLLTVEDIEDRLAEGERIELIRGEVVPMAPTGYEHGKRSGRLATYLGSYVLEHGIFAAEAGFVLERDPDTLLAPDLSFVRADREPPEGEQWRAASLAPDLVVEVLSPSDRASRVHDKVLTYLEAGVRLVWVVDPPRRTIQVFSQADPSSSRILTVNDDLTGDDVLPGFRIPVAKIFS
jgi:Uma2 family endonuclease